ncbi:hypothetical protein Esti_001483 [Eimeria stiedai]
MERDVAETQDLCVKALRSVRQASDVDLLVTIAELEGLVPGGASYKKLLSADAAHELLSIALEAINGLRMPVAQAALRLLNDGLQDQELTNILLIDVNLTASSVISLNLPTDKRQTYSLRNQDVLSASINKCLELDDFTSASVFELSVKVCMKMIQRDRARVFALLGESIHTFASVALRISLLCLGHCVALPEDKSARRSDLARRFAYEKPAVLAGRLFLQLLENAAHLVCQVCHAHENDLVLTSSPNVQIISQVDAQLEEVAACLMGNIPSGIVEIYGKTTKKRKSELFECVLFSGKIIHKALQAIFPKAQDPYRGSAVPPEEFDFYRRIMVCGDLSSLLLPLQGFDLGKFMEWRQKEKRNSPGKAAYDAGIKQLTPQPKQRVVFDGITLSIWEKKSPHSRSIPLYAITHIHCEGKSLKISYLQLPSDGRDPRIFLGNPDAFFEQQETTFLSFKSAKEAATLRKQFLQTFDLEEMEEYDSAFLEGVLDGLREPVDLKTAQKMQKPSQLLWPEIDEQQSLSLRLKDAAIARLSRLTLFASTKVGWCMQVKPQIGNLQQRLQDVMNKPQALPGTRNNRQFWSFLALWSKTSSDTHVGKNNHNNLAALPLPSKLSQWRRISLATTKSCETEGELPLFSLEKSMRGSLEQQHRAEHDETGLASSAAESRTSSISVSPPRPFEAWGSVAVPLKSQADAAAVRISAQQQQQQQQQQEAAAAREMDSQASRKRCESSLIDSGCGPSTPRSFASPQQQQRQQTTPRNAQTPPPVPSLLRQQQQTQQQHQQPASQLTHEECMDTAQDASGSFSLAPAASTNSKDFDGGTQEACASKASSPPPDLVPPKMRAALDPPCTLAVSAAELFAAFHQQQAEGGTAAWRKAPEPQTTLQLLALVTCKVREEKLAEVEKTQHTLQRLHEKVGKKLFSLLKAQEEERRQLGLAFAKAESKLLARLETQARAADAIPSLSLSAAKAATGDQVIEAASLEMQKILEAAKRGILDKLTAANAACMHAKAWLHASSTITRIPVSRAGAIPAAAAIPVPPAAAAATQQQQQQGEEEEEERGEMAPGENAASDPLQDVVSSFGVLALAYLEECEGHGDKPNPLLFRRLSEASAAHEEGKEIDLVCMGNEDETFFERLTDKHLSFLLKSLNQRNARLRSLNLSFQQLSETTGPLFAAYQAITGSLQSLRLRSNFLEEQAVEGLCEALVSCPSLTLLDLSLNKLHKKGGVAVGRLLAKTQKLKYLDLSDCQIDLEGFVHITTAVQDHNTVPNPTTS